MLRVSIDARGTTRVWGDAGEVAHYVQAISLQKPGLCGRPDAPMVAQSLKLTAPDDPRPWSFPAARATYAEDLVIRGNATAYIRAGRAGSLTPPRR